MPVRLFTRRMVWWPTWAGCLCILSTAAIPALLWWFAAEPFLAITEPIPNAEILVIEGWIGQEGVRATKPEIEGGNYSLIVTTNGLTGETWYEQRWVFGVEARKQLLSIGIPANKVIAAIPSESTKQRTFASAVAVRHELERRQLHPLSLNVVTLGSHARRSRMVFSKVFGPATKVGVIAWVPDSYHLDPWWASSSRASELLKETAAYTFELLLNSARISNSEPNLPANAPQ